MTDASLKGVPRKRYQLQTKDLFVEGEWEDLIFSDDSLKLAKERADTILGMYMDGVRVMDTKTGVVVYHAKITRRK